MNRNVAQSACLVLIRLVVPASRTYRRIGVTLEAEQVHGADFQHPWVSRTVRTMTTLASLGLHWYMLVDERPLFVSVALVANLVSTWQRADLTQVGSAVRIVAVAALDESFIDSVVIGPAEIRARRGMTAVTKLGLFLNQQILRLLSEMGRVAVEASDVAIAMGRLAEVSLLLAGSMATEATCARLLARETLEADDLADVPAPIDVSGARPVTVLTTVLAFFQEREVARTFKVLVVNIVMAGLAGVRSDVRTRRRIRSTLARCRLHLLSVNRTVREKHPESEQKHRNQNPAPESHRQVASTTSKHMGCHFSPEKTAPTGHCFDHVGAPDESNKAAVTRRNVEETLALGLVTIATKRAAELDGTSTDSCSRQRLVNQRSATLALG